MKKTNKIKNYSLKAAKIGKKKNVKGFTLVELIVVIAIIGVLAVVLVPNMMNYLKKASISKANDSTAKIAEQANLIAAELEMDGKVLSGNYATAAISFSSGENASDFASKLDAAVPDLNDDDKIFIAFGNDGQVAYVVYQEHGSASNASDKSKYIGAYPKATTLDDYKGSSYTFDSIKTACNTDAVNRGVISGGSTNNNTNTNNGSGNETPQ